MKPSGFRISSSIADSGETKITRSQRRLRKMNFFAAYALLMLALLGIVLVADAWAQTILMTTLQYPGVDKIGHALMHGVLTLVVYLSARSLGRRDHSAALSLIAFAVSGLLGFADELQQTLVPGRSFDGYDLLANLCGAGSMVILISLYHSRRVVSALALVLPLLLMTFVMQHDFNTSRFYKAGLMYLSHQQYAQAHDMFMQALQHGEQHAALYNELAWLELEHMDMHPESALSFTRKAIALQPDNPDYMDTHGWALYRNQHPDEALPYLLASYGMKPDGYCINYHLGAVFHALGEIAEARQYLQAQLDFNAHDRFADKARQLLATPSMVMATSEI